MTQHYKIHQGDVLDGLKAIPDGSVQCCVTSPPYWGLRDYGVDGQIGLEETPEAYVTRLVDVFREVRRVLQVDGTLWLNLGDTTRRKQLQGIPWRVAFALQSDGWYLRQDIIWHKPSPMPESVQDRCTKAHEYVFLLSKSARYYYDADAIDEPLATKPHAPGNLATSSGGHMRNDFGTDRMKNVWGASGRRNRRSVWKIATKPYKGAHFAVMPPELAKLCIMAGSSVGSTVLDPFAGSGTTLAVAVSLGRYGLGCELKPEYIELARQRIESSKPTPTLWGAV